MVGLGLWWRFVGGENEGNSAIEWAAGTTAG